MDQARAARARRRALGSASRRRSKPVPARSENEGSGISATANVPALADDDERGASQVAPMLPVEGHIVAAARALEAAKQAAERALFILQYAPRSRVDAFAALDAVYASAARGLNAYASYDA